MSQRYSEDFEECESTSRKKPREKIAKVNKISTSKTLVSLKPPSSKTGKEVEECKIDLKPVKVDS